MKQQRDTVAQFENSLTAHEVPSSAAAATAAARQAFFSVGGRFSPSTPVRVAMRGDGSEGVPADNVVAPRPVDRGLFLAPGLPSGLPEKNNGLSSSLRTPEQPCRLINPKALQQSPASARRWRRATDGGSSPFLTVVARRELKHLDEGPEVSPTVWPHPPPRKIISRVQPHRSPRRHTITGVCDLFDQLDARGRETKRPSSSRSQEPRLQEACDILRSQLAESSSREEELRCRIEELHAIVTSQQQAHQNLAHRIQTLEHETAVLSKKNGDLQADLGRRSALLHHVTSALPSILGCEGVGPLSEALSADQIQGVIAMLMLGAEPEDVHRLLLGRSETGADLNSFLHLAGLLREQFLQAEAAEDAVDAIGSARQSGQGLTRSRMIELLRVQDMKGLRAFGLDRSLLAEISLASLSDIDPCSIVNLLDGRISRGGTLDMTLAGSLTGILATLDDSKFGLQSAVGPALVRLKQQCPLSPVVALRQRHAELEAANVKLEAQLADMEHLLKVKHSHWTAENQVPPARDLWRIESLGTSGPSSPSCSSPAPIGRVC